MNQTNTSNSEPQKAVAPLQLHRPLVLVGLMGAGKTTVGRRLAKRLGVPFMDADEEIEKAAGMSVSDYFAQYGEPAFREGERRVIARLLGEAQPCVLATGGGAFMDAETRAVIAQTATSVWLRAGLDLLVKRTSKRNTRPLLRNGNPREILQKLIDERYPVYGEANIVIDSVDGPHDKVVDDVVQAVSRFQEHLV